MSAPKRIQRKRTKGWTMPEGAVYVGRPTRWGNPWREGSTNWTVGPNREIDRSGKVLTRADAVESFRNSMATDPEMVAAIRRELAGKDLACWCPLGQTCHVDVLLELANAD